MGATLATVNNILKEVYEPTIQDQLQSETVALKRIEKSSEGIESTVGGKYVTFPLHTKRNSGIGARNELEALPTPGQQGYAAARISLRYLYGGVRLTGQLIKLAQTNYQAFSSAMDSEFNGLKDDLSKDQNRQVFGTGSGAVATVTTLATTQNYIDPGVGGDLWAQLGEQIDLIDGTTLGNPTPTVKASNRQITAINEASGRITFDGAAVSSAVGDIIVRTGNVNREWSGLGSVIAASGTFQNVDPTLEPSWVASVDANSGTLRPISEGLMISMVHKIRKRGGGNVTAIFTNFGVQRAYFNLLQQQRRFTNTQEFTGGFSGLAFTTDKGDIPVVIDMDCPPNRMYFVNEKEITLFREADWSFMDEDGNKLFRVAGFDAYDATMFQYSNLGTHRRNSHGLISDVTEA
jgi:hypothetical protein